MADAPTARAREIIMNRLLSHCSGPPGVFTDWAAAEADAILHDLAAAGLAVVERETPGFATEQEAREFCERVYREVGVKTQASAAVAPVDLYENARYLADQVRACQARRHETPRR